MVENVRARALITGRVQGVAYRYETQWAAERLGVSGWVRNRADGSVEAVFEGERPKVEEMLAWCPTAENSRGSASRADRPPVRSP